MWISTMKITVPATILTILLTFALLGDPRAATAVLSLILCCVVLGIAVWLRLGPAEEPAAPIEPRIATTHELYHLRNGRCPACGGSDFLVSNTMAPMVRLQCDNRHVWFLHLDHGEIDHAVQMGDA
jgi:hypothetical protein